MAENCLDAPESIMTPSQVRLVEYVNRKEAGPTAPPVDSIPTAVPKSIFKVPIGISGLLSPGSTHGSRIVIQVLGLALKLGGGFSKTCNKQQTCAFVF
jgi:hypothetical protein